MVRDMGKYIVLGVTKKLGSRRILGRYKREDELWDVFEVEKLTKTARKLSVFEVLEEPTQDSWYLVSFDIKGWSNRTPSGSVYHKIAKEMFKIPCGKVDQSTYICPTDASDIPKKHTEYVRVWLVKPWNDNAKNAIYEAIWTAISLTIMEMRYRARRLKGYGVKKAREVSEQVILNYRTVLDKLESIGLGDLAKTAIITAESLNRMTTIKEKEDEVGITNELKASIYIRKEDHLTFHKLMPEAREDMPSIYVFGSIELTRGWGRVGQCQANIVGDTALIWECLVYRDAFIREDLMEANKKVWKFFEKYLMRLGARKFIANAHEPEYDNWPKFLEEMGYKMEGERAIKRD